MAVVDLAEARLLGQVVAATRFASMKWVTEQLGARAVIAAGMGIKDQVREAIQLLSATQIVERTVHTHTCWRKLDRGVGLPARRRCAWRDRSGHRGRDFSARGVLYPPGATERCGVEKRYSRESGGCWTSLLTG